MVLVIFTILLHTSVFFKLRWRLKQLIISIQFYGVDQKLHLLDTIGSKPIIEASSRHRFPRTSWSVSHSASLKMSGDKIKSLVELANNRLNSSEDFEQFQSFVTRELDLDTVSIYRYLCYLFFHNRMLIVGINYIYTIIGTII